MDNWDKVWEEGWRVGGGEEGLVIKKFCSDEGNYSDKTTCTDEKVLYQEAMSLVWMFVADRRLVTQAILFLVFEANLHSNIIHNSSRWNRFQCNAILEDAVVAVVVDARISER